MSSVAFAAGCHPVTLVCSPTLARFATVLRLETQTTLCVVTLTAGSNREESAELRCVSGTSVWVLEGERLCQICIPAHIFVFVIDSIV